MTPPPEERTSVVAREIAPDVYCLGPRGRTQTDVYFVRCGSSWSLIDAGWARDGASIKKAAESVFGVDTRPASILLTHSHPDHAGSALQLARMWDCAVYVHPDELPLATGDFSAITASAGPLDTWVILPLMRAMGGGVRRSLPSRASAASRACSSQTPGFRVFRDGSALPRRATRRATFRSFEPVTTS
jgi:hypothetical protein